MGCAELLQRCMEASLHPCSCLSPALSSLMMCACTKSCLELPEYVEWCVAWSQGLKLNQFVSTVSPPADLSANYDLYAVSNHYGSMAGGHYTAACRVGLPEGREQWYNFNDDAVSKLSPQSVVTPCAYMLFYIKN